MSYWELFFSGWAIVIAALTLIWVYALKSDHIGSVDIVWTALFAVLALWFIFLSPPGWWPRELLFGGLIGVYWLRLSVHFVDRVRRDQPDGRLEEIKRGWKNQALMTFLFFQFEGVFSMLLAVGYLSLLRDPTPEFRLWEYVGAGLILVAWWGENRANVQLNRFKRRPGSEGKSCREGLWRYSRHPNYFFQFLFWAALSVASIGAPYFWVSLVTPVTIYVLLRYISGVRPTEQQALKSRGDDYRRYQQETSPFFPWFPKRLD